MDRADGNGEYPIFKLFSGPTNAPLEQVQLEALALVLHDRLLTRVNLNVRQVASDNTALHLAVQRRSPIAVAMLIHRGADVNARNASGTTPLLAAANQWRAFASLSVDQETMLSYLLDAPDVQVDVRGGSFKRTALHVSALQGCPKATTILLQQGADPRLRDTNGKDALALAKAQQDFEAGIPQVQDSPEVRQCLLRYTDVIENLEEAMRRENPRETRS